MSFKSLAQSLRFLCLAFIPLGGRVETLYRTLSDTNSLCREKLYLNLGYWRDNPSNLDAAAQSLADLCARTALLSESDTVLDAGFGFGDQDIFWIEKYNPRVIYGVNISPEQVVKAKGHINERGLESRIRLSEGDATRLLFPEAMFDVVIAMESAFHFRTREDFFREAYRVLKPGGRFVLADLAASSNPLALKDRIAETIGRSFWQIPRENLYPIETYRKKLELNGFNPVDARSIWSDVYPKFVDYARVRLRDKDIARRMNPLYRRMLASSLKARRRLSQKAMDYLLVVAIKPGP